MRFSHITLNIVWKRWHGMVISFSRMSAIMIFLQSRQKLKMSSAVIFSYWIHLLHSFPLDWYNLRHHWEYTLTHWSYVLRLCTKVLNPRRFNTLYTESFKQPWFTSITDFFSSKYTKMPGALTIYMLARDRQNKKIFFQASDFVMKKITISLYMLNWNQYDVQTKINIVLV